MTSCHKLNPSGGQGAITAMHDAIALANLVYALPSNSTKDIHKTFAEYQEEIFQPAVEASQGSLLLSMILSRGGQEHCP
ncbi:hypothetical protein BGX33_005401 [Mortierella sp. NVP41]|nr:hypothetical protein BGX33_005401 [Mortierella sp. NVP41]